ncbi:hypothetical protein DL764_008959 [Monosporascus ibericus]|uniref:Uncharacterized protein n=1 Tax=Monosporascus ibericus TaxID=155417 RepID=A0A4Q4SYE9_9PEZI|nr:hypothetical protein DL764_008959 [Monosporascus ibericus]
MAICHDHAFVWEQARLHQSCGPAADLSPFRHLQSLCWKAPTIDNLETLSDAIRLNAARQQKLDLDFVDWPDLRQSLGYESDDEEDEAQSYFADIVLELNGRSPRPYFPDIRVLSLSQVPLNAAMALAINFNTLVSLTLRKCPSWDKFLERVLERNYSIRLRTLEIQDSESASQGFGRFVLGDFLDAFEGLEELSIIEPGPADSIEVWNHAAHHRATLKKFVYHQRIVRIVDLDEESPYFEEHDLPNLAIIGPQMRQIKEDPSQNPLARLDLECIGLACVPDRLSRSDIEHYKSWAQENRLPSAMGMPIEAEPENEGSNNGESGSSVSLGSWAYSGPPSEAESVPSGSNVEDFDMEQNESLGRLRREFRRFVEWVFGSQGVSSLQVVAFGDFANGGWLKLEQDVSFNSFLKVSGSTPLHQFSDIPNYPTAPFSLTPHSRASIREGTFPCGEKCSHTPPPTGYSVRKR